MKSSIILVLLSSLIFSCNQGGEKNGGESLSSKSEYEMLKGKIKNGKATDEDYVKMSQMQRLQKSKRRPVKQFRESQIFPQNIIEDQLFDLQVIDSQGNEVKGHIWYKALDERVHISQSAEGSSATIAVSEPGEYQVEAFLVPKGLYKKGSNEEGESEFQVKFLQYVNGQETEDDQKKAHGFIRQMHKNADKGLFRLVTTITVEEDPNALPCQVTRGQGEENYIIPSTNSFLCVAANDFFGIDGLNFHLDSDIDLRGLNFKIFYTASNIDGHGHTIHWDFSYPEGLSEQEIDDIYKYDIGIFGFTANNTIKNLNIEVGNIIAHRSANVAPVVGNTDGTHFENITVNHNGVIEAGDQRSGFSGFNGQGFNSFENITINNLKFRNCTSAFDNDGFRGVTGGIGTFLSSANYKNIEINNMDVECDNTGVFGLLVRGEINLKDIRMNNLKIKSTGGFFVSGLISLIDDVNGEKMENISLNGIELNNEGDTSAFMLIASNTQNATVNDVSLTMNSPDGYRTTGGVYIYGDSGSRPRVNEQLLEDISVSNIVIHHTGYGRVSSVVGSFTVGDTVPKTTLRKISVSNAELRRYRGNFDWDFGAIGCLWGGHFGGNNHLIEDIKIENCRLYNERGRAGLLGGEIDITSGFLDIKRVNIKGEILESGDSELEGSGLLGHYGYQDESGQSQGVSIQDASVYTLGIPNNYFSAGVLKYDFWTNITMNRVYHNGIITPEEDEFGNPLPWTAGKCIFANVQQQTTAILTDVYHTGCVNPEPDQGIAVDQANALDRTFFSGLFSVNDLNDENIWTMGEEGPEIQNWMIREVEP